MRNELEIGYDADAEPLLDRFPPPFAASDLENGLSWEFLARERLLQGAQGRGALLTQHEGLRSQFRERDLPSAEPRVLAVHESDDAVLAIWHSTHARIIDGLGRGWQRRPQARERASASAPSCQGDGDGDPRVFALKRSKDLRRVERSYRRKPKVPCVQRPVPTQELVRLVP